MSVIDETPLSPGNFAALIDAQAGAALATDDVLLLVLPLFAQVTALHEAGRVAVLSPDVIVLDGAGALALRNTSGQAATMVSAALMNRVQPVATSTLNIVGALRLAHDADGRERVDDLAVQADTEAPIEQPVYLPGYRSWELALGQHDELTDIFQLGMLLAALACGLDFDDIDDLRSFAGNRNNLFVLAPRLHPVLASVIVEMTALNRHDRATELGGLAARLRTWRDQPDVLDVARALSGVSGLSSRRGAVLSHLRDRLFDLSRRNRLLFFRPTAGSVNITVSSVPLMLQVESIQPEHICTWSGPFAAELTAGKAVDLQRWLRFDDQPFLPSALDKLIQETRRDRAEYGFSNLRLVVAFLRWHNLKEFPEERITTPLLWLPVELVKRKGVRDQYVLQAEDGEAEFNPVLRHQLRQLYDIQLPETVDLQKTSIAQIHADLLAQIRRTEPSVELRLLEKAQIKLVRQKALQRLQQFQRRRPSGRSNRALSAHLPDYSYEREDYRPLGQALFERWVRPSALPQRFEAGAAPSAGPRHARMVEAADAERVGYALQEAEGHRYAWDLDLAQVTLANFNYKKMSLVRDYTQLLEGNSDNPAFDHVFSIEPRPLDAGAADLLPLREQWNVIASDATQGAAVGLARSQRSFIIQGPPGTGKSQTITNLIADYAGRGKRVLFVCEKRAALDVVFHRLKQAGLDPLCCLIHDSQADKKAFIADLRGCYERWVAQPHDSELLNQQRNAVLDKLQHLQARIDGFEQAMSSVPEPLGTSVRQLVRRMAELPAMPEVDAARREVLPNLAAWDGQRELALRVQRNLQERFGIDSLATHPFGRLSAALVTDERAFGRVQQLVDDCETLLEQLDPVLEDSSGLIKPALTPTQALQLAEQARWLLDNGMAAHLQLLDAASSQAVELQRASDDLEKHQAVLQASAQTTAHWRDKLSQDDTEAALALAQQLERSLTRWLQPAWWRLRGELRRRYDFGKHAVHPGYARVLQALVAEHAASAGLAQADARSCRQFGVTSMRGLLDALARLRELQSSSAPMRAMLAHLDRALDPVTAARNETLAAAPLHKLIQRLGESVDVQPELSLEQVAELMRDLREGLEELPDLLPLLRAVHAGDPAVSAALRQLPLPVLQIESLVADEALRRLERAHPELARFDGAALAGIARHIGDGQRELLGLNAKVVQATLHRLFAGNVQTSSLSATQLDAAGKDFKKRYATGRRELEHEFGKSMRHRSIRDLSDDETGLVVNDLKPIWLMSPLSVSDTLPLSPDLFDVVIFDEASQIPTEEAVPALSRARQIVVVGDEMQLPPTSFFSAAGEEEEEVVVEEDGERIAINMDSDSLLNQAARNLPATLLAWHYRSRHEALISFSNAAFYDGRLVTIPDRRIEPAADAPAPLHSTQDDAGSIGADALQERAVSFHHVADGVYGARRNPAEARYIAQMVRELLHRGSGQSIGIVAFSEAQQAEIETALEALALEDPEFALQLEREYVREDEDQFNGLFVKNLENVQGDERDLIILSICYAPGADGRMLMNFGPINQRGGEKRLNVIFSRARLRMAVVSSIHAEAITNTHNDGAAALRAFLQFAQANARGDFERAQLVLGALNAGAREAFSAPPSADAIRQAMAAALRQHGHVVHEQVGRSQFRCDLAIVDPAGGDYQLAILLDDPQHAIADTRERYVFRPGVLRGFGWKVIDVPGRDWLRAPDAVLARIESALQGVEPEQDDAFDLTVVQPLPAQSVQVSVDDMPPRLAEASVTRSLVFDQGSSNKFWRVSVSGSELAVNYGRIGSSGQRNIKVFDSAERARREMDKLVAEKLGKGYREA
ncbi:AAA domain-containing protein [uncultured Stenotrophomonas sp.]|uniref:AAA domain-containing protein n=1 Tax=uncultured Stenotrophomonas sp. TaxID=165438 RepID=UPI0025E8113E|nr:AAA domain-containing protein [uncultured Stenotrophomonas sp.]